MPRLRVGVVFGGRSGEHEVSLASAASVIAALEELGHAVVPPGIARSGRWGVGGDPLRALAARARVALPSRAAQTLGFPCFVKPANLGSSVGISKVRDAAALPAAVDLAAGHDRKIVVERAVRGREIEVSVLGNDEPAASLPCEITYESEWYDYSTKYLEGQARVTVPAPVSPEITRQVRELAIAAFRAIDCSGMARVDFFLEGDRLLINEINTIPGFTSTSGYAKMWEATGLRYTELIDRLIALALERHRDKSRAS